ncbi:SpoIIE family protein phosphatase [Desulfococcaceae bacterium HSG8]|nr:SpoIIE family protein phosphatase [Desulfococcaceae bacterium HSG8]
MQTAIKHFLIIFLPLMILVSGITTLIYNTEIRKNRVLIETNEIYIASMLAQVIIGDFKSVLSDLMILSEKNELQAMLRTGDIGHRKALAKEFLSYSARKKVFDQIRFLDDTGTEVIRINFNSGYPYIAPEDQLQFKGDRYYFKDAFKRRRGEIFLSSFDLNIENGKIEQPIKPTIRFGTPVFDIYRNKRGVLLLNYFGTKIIRNIENSYTGSPGRLMLLNRKGFWLKGPVPEYEWGFMYEDRKNRTFGNAFPEAWQQITARESGQFYDADDLFTFITVFPMSTFRGSASSVAKHPENSGLYWKIISHIPENVLKKMYQEALDRLILLNAVLIPLLAVCSWILARTHVKRREAEKAVKENLNFLQTLMNTIPVPIFYKDTDCLYQGCNAAFEKILGMKKQEVIEKTVYDLAPENMADKYHEMDLKLLQGAGVQIYETQVRYADGKFHDIIFHKARFINSENDTGGLVGAMLDITDIRQLEESLRETHERITDSIQYAKMIQRSLLPNPENINAFLPESFFIWQPRDIVGGDFIFTDCSENGIIIAVMDCTGHGVPGAFMTMVATFSLRKIIRDERCQDPGEILKQLNLIVKKTLQQDTKYALSDDGLDAAVCFLSGYLSPDGPLNAINKGQLTFSGARLPLICIHNSETTVIKGDKQSIGYKKSDINFEFTKHTIPIEKGMSFYMFTDGFADQLGGERGRRFGTRRLKHLLNENALLPFEKQREALLRTFDEYRGENERQDDVTVLGFGF